MPLYIVDMHFDKKVVIAKNKQQAVDKLIEFIVDGRLKPKCSVKRIPKSKT